MRQFIRHPVDVPVKIGTAAGPSPQVVHTQDISAGGLALCCKQEMQPGALVQVSIPFVEPAFEARARVAWCRCRGGSDYELGVTFLDPDDAFRARMVEQICHIEDYRQSVLRRDGRQLDMEQAAHEWLEIYAADFPDIGSGPAH